MPASPAVSDHPLPAWPAGPVRPRLETGEIHLWRATLDEPRRLAGAEAVLSREEILRTRRFTRPVDQERFIAAHGALRMVLGNYLLVDPQELEFRAGPHGKPVLVQTFTDLRFNLSHSGDLALIAVARGREVGVDVERMEREIEYEPIVEQYFDPTEAWELRTAPPEERVARFFDLWTRKEACLKAEGVGLVSPSRSQSFRARNLCPASGYAGAVASDGEDWRLTCWHWNV
ncbi:MAG: 4'-phosphopantetheinyl transferase superfamily protein [Chthoniobacter sp.]|uniref:4'-phosphopantetheinyl transferase family protein n=1 Tax=Chthoniobacter sp. TaxID=2510640 RepID=UPI0032A9548C